MKIKEKTKKSWENGKDCFENNGEKTIDHIYPLAKGGSSILENKQFLSEESNLEKGDKTRGKIGQNWKFAILQQTTNDDDIYGIMFIRHKDWEKNVWQEIEPVYE